MTNAHSRERSSISIRENVNETLRSCIISGKNCKFVNNNLLGKMTIDDIKDLIASDESRILELKKTTGELKDGMHTACAFLNTEGGWLIFGIAPKSLKIIGQ